MQKTIIEKVSSTSSGATVFKIGGTLGFHEKNTLAKLFTECEKRGISTLIMDLSALTSLGGGCAKIICKKADEGNFRIGVAGASKSVLKFLDMDNERSSISFAPTVEELLEKLGITVEETIVQADLENASPRAADEGKEASEARVPESPLQPEKRLKKHTAPKTGVPEDTDQPVPEDAAQAVPDGAAQSASDRAGQEQEDVPSVICLGLEGDAPSGEEASASTSPSQQAKGSAAPAAGEDRRPDEATSAPKVAPARNLKKRLIQYSTLLSIGSDLARIREKSALLDAFLLSVVAQVGVESAVFLQRQEGVFVPVAAKGIGLDKCQALRITAQAMNLDSWLQSEEVLKIPESPIEEPVKESAEDLGLVLITPFIVYEDLCGLVMLGKSIRKSVDPDSIDVLKIMVRQAAIAYENARYFEQESERSLGVVQTLISLIEENTLARGNTELVANYSYALAKKMEYPEEQYRDFMFGVVLRDIGMIKVSDLIVRSPRELAKEEWEIIKRHPIDGADMLRKMGFSEHAINIVLYHHERFNGEGYPNKLQGNQIPLGARIVSVVESFAAMLHDRPTRPALTQEEALNTLKENWGMRYDPDVVKAFVEIIEEEIRTGEKKRYTNRELFNV